MTLIYKWLPYIFEILRSKVLNSVSFMKETLKYLAGITGPSGYGSKSTAEQVTQDCMGFIPSNLTAIVTG